MNDCFFLIMKCISPSLSDFFFKCREACLAYIYIYMPSPLRPPEHNNIPILQVSKFPSRQYKHWFSGCLPRTFNIQRWVENGSRCRIYFSIDTYISKIYIYLYLKITLVSFTDVLRPNTKFCLPAKCLYYTI